MPTLFQFNNASLSVGGRTILSKINWKISSGHHSWIAGPNGCGKTTLCKALIGKSRISQGSARPINIGYDEVAMVSFTDTGSLFHSVNNYHYYQQRFNAWDSDGHLTVRDYMNAKGAKLSVGRKNRFIEAIGLSDLLDLERIKLSSGQTRKMLLASALLKKPTILILDNAYIGLDNKSRTYLNEYLDQLVDETGITLILSGHVTQLPKCIKEHVQIKNGQLSIENDRAIRKNDFTLSEYKKKIINNIKDYNSNNINSDAPSEIIHFENVSISYKGHSIFKLKKWTVRKGESWCVFGKNGSGKSTIVSMIYADHPQAYSKSLRIFGAPLGKGRSIWEIKKWIGFTSPELHAYFRANLSALEVILTGLFDKFEIMGKVPKEKRAYAKELSAYFNLTPIIDLPYHQLATGHQRLCLFLRALIKCPVLYLLDEPFQGLDESNVHLAKELLNEIISPEQSLIFISHFKSEIPSSVRKTLNLT